jgi:hypothetical protein
LSGLHVNRQEACRGAGRQEFVQRHARADEIRGVPGIFHDNDASGRHARRAPRAGQRRVKSFENVEETGVPANSGLIHVAQRDRAAAAAITADFEEDSFFVARYLQGLAEVGEIRRVRPARIPLGVPFLVLPRPFCFQNIESDGVLIDITCGTSIPDEDKAAALGDQRFDERSAMETSGASVDEDEVCEIQN